MEAKNFNNPGSLNFEKTVEIIIRLGVLFLILGWCITLLRPFVLILIWAAIIAIAVYPLYNIFSRMFRGHTIVASVVLTLLMLSVLIVPAWLVTQSLFDGINYIRELYSQGQPIIPPLGKETENWPAITQPIKDIWKLASENLQAALSQYSAQLKIAGGWLLSSFAGIGIGVLQFIVSIIIAGVLLAFSTSVGSLSSKIFIKLAGKNGEHFADATVNTVRSVVKGILGVAVIQATMAGLGFFIAGVPFAGLWTVACLVLAIIQVGAGPVAIPVTIYMFTVADSLTATLLAVWIVITLISDNILKPLLLGRGASAPMLVVFLGAIGGFISSGFLGLFLGAVVLTIGYKLFLTWLDSTPQEN